MSLSLSVCLSSWWQFPQGQAGSTSSSAAGLSFFFFFFLSLSPVFSCSVDPTHSTNFISFTPLPSAPPPTTTTPNPKDVGQFTVRKSRPTIAFYSPIKVAISRRATRSETEEPPVACNRWGICCCNLGLFRAPIATSVRHNKRHFFFFLSLCNICRTVRKRHDFFTHTKKLSWKIKK